MCIEQTNRKFQPIGSPERIWAVSAIHSEAHSLMRLHDAVLEKFRLGDKLVYLGNYTGHATYAPECIDEILTFRRLLLSTPGMRCSDIIYLRGAQEEMLHKILQLQFAPDPTSVLLWMLGNGLSGTLQGYGLCAHDGIEACRNGVMGITKWTAKIREAIRSYDGHEIFSTKLVRAAYTSETEDYPMLFVHAGIDTQRKLDDQGDDLWWAGDSFSGIDSAYEPFRKVVRGYDPAHKGVHLNCVTATIDGGAGFGGNLVCAGFNKNGEVFELLEA